MRTIFYLLTFALLIFICNSSAQIVGRLVDENGDGLYEVTVDVHLGNNMYSSATDIDGNFTISTTVSVEDEILPEGYTVSDNYPNPFNPKTRFNISVPQKSNVEIRIYNLLGQEVADRITRVFDTGINSVDLELNGLANGIYLARISIDHKYSVTKKLMLIYGSQHLNTAGNSIANLGKSNLSIQNRTETPIDSLVVYGALFGRNVFTQLPDYNGELLDIGTLEITLNYCPGIPAVNYEGKIYRTVQIGNQCWLRENLDVGDMIESNASGSLQTDNGVIEKYCYNNDLANCETYGGLYEWSEAMQYTLEEGTQGICPESWHIASFADFEELRAAVNDDGNSLKVLGQGSGAGAGTNTNGFSAWLAGYRDNSWFEALYSKSTFWTSTEQSGGYSYYFMNSYHVTNILSSHFNKVFGLSVRCVKETLPTFNIPSLLSPLNNSANVSTDPILRWERVTYVTSYSLQVSEDSLFKNFVYNQSGLTTRYLQIFGLNNSKTYYWRVSAENSNGTSGFSDPWSFTTLDAPIPCPGIPQVVYGGKTYNTVQIGNQCWLKENLDIGTMIESNTPGGFQQTDNGVIEKYCYDNDPVNCDIYGGLYEWPEAMQYDSTEFSRGICPEGWHLPTQTEFDELKTNVNGDGNVLKAVGQGSGFGAGTDASGFSALLAGDRTSYGNFDRLSESTHFWSSTDRLDGYVGGMFLYFGDSGIYYYYNYKEGGISVRCIKD